MNFTIRGYPYFKTKQNKQKNVEANVNITYEEIITVIFNRLFKRRYIYTSDLYDIRQNVLNYT